jgi:hypothetical protein
VALTDVENTPYPRSRPANPQADPLQNVRTFLQPSEQFEQKDHRMLHASIKQRLQTNLTEQKTLLCDTLILSAIEYCGIVYWPAILNKDKESLQRVQNCCLRFCFNIRKFDHISYKYKEAGWMRLPERFLLHFGVFLFQLSKRQLPHYLYKKLIKHSDIHNRPTRYNDYLLFLRIVGHYIKEVSPIAPRESIT